MQGLRIAVLGCGPGGMAAALLLKRSGHEPEIFERFEKPKPIGSGLLIQPSGQDILNRLNLLETITPLAARVERLYGISQPHGLRALDMEYRHIAKGACALGVHRSTLFDHLFSAVQKAGISIKTGCEMPHSCTEEHDTSITLTVHNRLDRFDLIVDAMGAHSPLGNGRCHELAYGAFWTTVPVPQGTDIAHAALDQRYHSAQQMAGIMPVGTAPGISGPAAALFWSARTDTVQSILQQGIGKWREDFTTLWPQAEPFITSITDLDGLTFAQYSHRTGDAVQGQRLFHIGDSWHCTSPQLGQGANMALIDAAALADAIANAAHLKQISILYKRNRMRHVLLYQALSRIFTPLYQSDSRLGPLLRDRIVHYTARLPGIRSVIAQIVSGTLGKK